MKYLLYLQDCEPWHQSFFSALSSQTLAAGAFFLLSSGGPERCPLTSMSTVSQPHPPVTFTLGTRPGKGACHYKPELPIIVLPMTGYKVPCSQLSPKC